MPRNSISVSTKQERIAELAKQSPQMAFTSLAYLVDIDWLKEAYRRTRKDGAVGVDGVTAAEYEQDLEGNLPQNCEVALISLRPEKIDERKGRGLVLHHGRAGELSVESEMSEEAQWVGVDLLRKIDDLLSSKNRQSGRPIILRDYRDPVITGGRTYWGAIQQIRSVNADWLAVLVQEPQPF